MAKPLARRPRGRALSACPVRPLLTRLEDRTTPSAAAVDRGDFYWADGRQVHLHQRLDQYAVGLPPGADLAALTADGGPLAGFHVARAFGTGAAIVEADAGPRVTGGLWAAGDAWAAGNGVAWVTPVFEAADTGGYAAATDEVVVRLRDGVTAEAFFAGDPRFLGHRRLQGTPDQFIATVAAGRGRPAIQLANALMSDPRLLWATPNLVIESRPAANDPLLGLQWHLNNTGQSGGTPDADVDAPEAWQVTAGSPNIVIADIDDAIQRDHPDLAPNVWVNPGEIAGNGVDDDGNGYVDDDRGWDFWDDDNDPSPNPGSGDHHGTATAGVAVAAGDNNLGVAGVAYGSRLMPIRSNIVPDFSPPDVPTAVYYAAGRTADGLGTWRGADVLTCSWIFYAPFQPLSDAFAWASANGRGGKGLPSFCATGNGGTGDVAYPASLAASLSGVIAVGGSNHLDERTGYAQYGPELDLVAPTSPSGIVTTDRTGPDGYSSNDYNGFFGGTSSATPLAAGVGALALSRDPNLTAAQLRGLLRNTTDLIGPLAYDPATGKNLEYGYGRVNAFAAVSGVGVAEVQVLDGTSNVADGAALDFFLAPGGFVETTFRVRNQGTLDLTLGTPSIGSGPFTIVSGFTDPVLSAGESTTIRVRFTPQAGPLRTQVLSFTTNDADEGAFDITLRGAGGLFAAPASTAVGTNTVDAVAADFNGDGRLDAALATATSVRVLLNAGNGAFQPPATYGVAAGSAGLALADFNGDGRVDIFSIDAAGAQGVHYVLLGNADGTFAVQPAGLGFPAARGVAAGDFNGDGHADVAIASDALNAVRLFLGTGAGTFTAGATLATAAAQQVRAGDFNGDGLLDLVADGGGVDTAHVRVFLGVGGGAFPAGAVYPAAGRVDQLTVGDLTGDGRPELVIASALPSSVSVLRGNADGTFQAAVVVPHGGGTPNGLATADFDRDGRADILVATETGSATALLGNGDLTFRRDGPYPAGGLNPRYAVAGDFTGDGAADALVGNAAGNGSTVALLRNQTPAPARVQGTPQVNDGTAQRSRVTRLTVTFTGQVSFAGPVANAFTVSRSGGAAVGGFTATASVAGGVTVVVLSGFTGAGTEFGSLADGFYTLRVVAGQVSSGGVPLDGDGDGVGGDDYVLAGTVTNGLYRLYGESDGDGVVNAFDFGRFRPAFGASAGDPAYVDWLDFDASGTVNAFDFGRFRTRFGGGVP